MKKQIMLGCLAALFATTTMSADQAAEKSKGDEMASAQCGAILDLFEGADPLINKNKKALAAAQDRTYVFLMWAHGYVSGRDGVDFVKRPLNQEGITRLVADIYTVCKTDEKRLFLDAVKDIR